MTHLKMITFDVCEKNIGNNQTELQDLESENNETVSFENAVEVLSSNIGSEIVNSEENAGDRIKSERMTHSNDNDAEHSETRDKQFSNHADVERHERTRGKPLKCPQCNKLYIC